MDTVGMSSRRDNAFSSSCPLLAAHAESHGGEKFPPSVSLDTPPYPRPNGGACGGWRGDDSQLNFFVPFSLS